MSKSTAAVAALSGLEPVGAPLVFGRWHHDLLTWRGFRLEIRTAVKAALGARRDGPKFLIIARARSGSTLLCDLLDANPDIHCDLEMLHYRVMRPRAFLANLAVRRKARVYGCKFLSYQMIQVQRLRDPAGFLARLHDDGFQFVHLTRNTFDQSLSLSMAQSTGVYFGTGPRGKVSIDPDLFVRQLRWNAALLDMENEILRGLPVLGVDYDRDLVNAERQQATMDWLCPALGASPAPVKTAMRKGLQKGFDDLVENAEAVRKAVVAAGLRPLLEAV